MVQKSLAEVEKVLTQRELEVYTRYVESGKPPMALSTSMNFFQLFLNGKTCDEIAQANPGFSLGLILKARVDHDWDKIKAEHLRHLSENIKSVVQKAQLGAIQFIAEGMAAFQKRAGDKFQKYLVSGKEEDLGDFKNLTVKQYKEMIELLMKLTGQDVKTSKVHGTVEHKLSLDTPTTSNFVDSYSLPKDRHITSEEATEFLKRVDPKLKK